MEQYKEYIANVDKILDTQEEILFGGISTVEINERKSPNGNFEGTLRNMTRQAGNKFGANFNNIRQKIIAFWYQYIL